MPDFLHRPESERRLLLEQASDSSGHLVAVVEKDFWVTWTLAALFSLPGWGSRLTFKGGTSLSKGYGLIQRFSEDIDLVVDRRSLGFPAGTSIGSKQLKKLRVACREAVRNEIRPALEERIAAATRRSGATLTDDPDAPDEPTLLFHYPSDLGPAPSYVRAIVKMEFGARSDVDPADERPIASLLSVELPSVVSEAPVVVRTLSPRRTFLEKLLLVHEENVRPAEGPRAPRLSRHYYDLWCLIRAGIGQEALDVPGLFAEVLEHRRVFFRRAGVDYDAIAPGQVLLVPPEGRLAAWRSDYDAMSVFFSGETPPQWTEILEGVARFERTILRGSVA